MKELDNKEVGQIRFEFTDGTWFILDHQSLKHLKTETKLKMDFVLSEVFEEIECKRLEAGESDSNNDLGINVDDSIKTRDIGPGQK